MVSPVSVDPASLKWWLRCILLASSRPKVSSTEAWPIGAPVFDKKVAPGPTCYTTPRRPMSLMWWSPKTMCDKSSWPKRLSTRVSSYSWMKWGPTRSIEFAWQVPLAVISVSATRWYWD